MPHMSRLVFSLLISTGCAFGASLATAQDYPTKPIRFIVPNTSGGTQDVVARIMGPEMSKLLGQPIVVENKSGAGQSIGLEYVAKQVPADGYTIAIASVQTLVTLALLVKNLRFDPLRDLPPVVGLAEGRFIFGSSSRLPWKTFDAMVANAKANPGKLNYGSSSPILQLMTEALIRGRGLNVIHVPYKGAGPYLQGLLAGEVHMGFTAERDAVAAGERFRVLAVTGQQRLAAFRDVPTFAELGEKRIRGFSFSMNVPAGTPKATIDKLYGAASRVLKQPDVRTLFANQALEISEQTPETAAESLAEEGKLFADIAKQIGMQPQ